MKKYAIFYLNIHNEGIFWFTYAKNKEEATMEFMKDYHEYLILTGHEMQRGYWIREVPTIKELKPGKKKLIKLDP